MGEVIFVLYDLSNIRSRSASAENPQALPSAGGRAANGRKGAPCIVGVKPGITCTLLDCDGPGVIRRIWCTIPPGNIDHLRNSILRMYWDGQSFPSVEVPLGDFFGLAHGRQRNLISELICVQNGTGFNCWIPMPFAKHARITFENDSCSEIPMLFYQVDFTCGDAVNEDAGYFHAQFRRSNPCPMHEDYTILDEVSGRGVYLGTVLGVRSRYNESWWGEGEVKFFIDGEEYPTICGTGTEDYIGFAWGLGELCTPWQGCPYKNDGLGLYSFYRFHARDPIYFQKSLKVTIQQIGYGSRTKASEFYGNEFASYPAAGAKPGDDMCYYDRSDDFCSVSYWYQSLLAQPFPLFPDREKRSADLMIGNNEEKQGRNDI